MSQGANDYWVRRVQAAAVFWHVFMFIFAPIPLAILVVLTLFSPLCILSVFYLLWMYYDRNSAYQGGRASESYRNRKLWRYFADYFPAKLIKTAELSADRNYIFGLHPHGVLGLASFLSFGTNGTHFDKLFPGIQRALVTLPANFRMPIVREYTLAGGMIASSRESIDYVLSGLDGRGTKGRAVAIVVGGAEEALDSHPGLFELELKRRRGFVRLAIQHGASLVPVFHFGETDLYNQLWNKRGSWLRRAQQAFKQRFSFSPPIFSGRGIFNHFIGFVPFRTPINTVVGAPIDVEQCEQPTGAQINALHAAYCDALTALFDAHKTRFGIDASATLNIC